MSILSSGREPVLPTYGTGTRAAHRCVWFSLYNPGLMVFFKKCEFIAKTFFKISLIRKLCRGRTDQSIAGTVSGGSFSRAGIKIKNDENEKKKKIVSKLEEKVITFL